MKWAQKPQLFFTSQNWLNSLDLLHFMNCTWKLKSMILGPIWKSWRFLGKYPISIVLVIFSFPRPLDCLGPKSKGMFGNCFFPLFSVFKNNFLFFRLKNLFGNPKWIENKNYSQNSICEGNWKHTKCCFQFLIFKSQWKQAFNLMNLSHLMS